MSLMPPYSQSPPENNATAPAGIATVDRARHAARGEHKREYVQAMFSDIAPRYDLLNHILSLNIDKGWRRRALAALNWIRVPSGRYLDLCAGTLDVGALLGRQRGFSGFIVGADFALSMLQHGAGKAPPTVLAPVAADALALPMASATFDGAIVAFGIRNVADIDAGLREVRRLLRPGARFVILEFSTPSSALVRRFYHAYFHFVLPFVGRMVSGHTSAYTYLPLSVADFPTRDALAARMIAAGFVKVTWQPLTLGIAAIHVGEVPAHPAPLFA
ncbi:MAG: ubiquinone/menaquinone biosynthesis methyltransferase [Gemmatimonadota bacterium]|nr:ubiquinone/menaquinone biosynthesis methyltransferase [Gemmatimonadota bacterium]